MIFRSIIPPSIDNSNHERLEYFLVWLSPNGGVRQWLFASTENQEEERIRSFTIESSDNIRSIPYEDRKTVNLEAQSLDGDSFDYVKTILKSNLIKRVYKDGSSIPLAIEDGRTRRNNKLKEFSISLTVIHKEEGTLDL